jgi:hypothetical protein
LVRQPAHRWLAVAKLTEFFEGDLAETAQREQAEPR